MNLAIFTNCTNDVLSRPTITATYQSYIETFGIPDKLTVFYDPNPNKHDSNAYYEALCEWFGKECIVITKGLADGYRQALNSESEYIFMLEHDWAFKNISHSLKEILQTMKDDNLWFMLFNKHSNEYDESLSKWQLYFKPHNDIYCLSDRVSNNPHIINREYYLKNIAPLIDWNVSGAGMIEQVLQKNHEIAVYGKYGNQPTIQHLNGRRGGKK